MNYSEKLKDPRWQKKRLEIFQRDGFKCRLCTNEKLTLHAHHRFYREGLEPWDYENEALITLCETCHGQVHLPNAWAALCVEKEVQRQACFLEVEFQTRMADGWMSNFLTLTHSLDLLQMAVKCCQADAIVRPYPAGNPSEEALVAVSLRMEFRRALEAAKKEKEASCQTV